ncbi:DNA internalization-related competence protein ComEC/Rec2 [Desulfatiglans anilini]|uniref:DNA internalization-related competence protein ComEC/Rec2 n=1 Tax=Desulfatiglans anilini TaxID=90728 RepID=UPI00042619D8|nr:DNA internalization-related competence protein ComEC/Rec2 [Desulfatiglans anilini]
MHRPLVPVLCAWVAGILLGHRFHFAGGYFVAALGAAAAVFVLLTLLFPRGRRVMFLLPGIVAAAALVESIHHPLPILDVLAPQEPQLGLVGTVLNPVRAENGRGRFALAVERVIIGRTALSADEKVLVSVYGKGVPLRAGERVQLPARLRVFRNFANPGAYDYEGQMACQGFSCRAVVSDGRLVVPLGYGERLPVKAFFEEGRERFRGLLIERLDERRAAFSQAILLGDRSAVDQTTQDRFNVSGLAHILAVSGLHMGLLAGLTFFGLRRLLLYSPHLALCVPVGVPAASVTALTVLVYLGMAGFQVSAQRAVLMVLIFLGAGLWGRSRDRWSTLALAALLILAVDPQAIFSISFQLSFGAVAGLLWFMPVFTDRLGLNAPRKGSEGRGSRRVFGYFAGLAAVSLCATLFLLPLTVYYFHRFPLVVVPANLSAVPILGCWVLPLGLFGAFLLPFSEEAAGVLVEMSGWGQSVVLWLVRFWADLPWAGVWLPTPNGFEIALFYLGLLSLYFFRRSLWAKRLAMSVALLVLFDSVYWVKRVYLNEDMRVTFLDVGQGNAALVEFPGGKKMLVDGGGFSGGTFDVGRMVVAPFLWQAKIRQLDYLVLSHPEADHMGGLPFIAASFSPSEFWYNGDTADNDLYRRLALTLEEERIFPRLPPAGPDATMINGVRVEVLQPGKDGMEPEAEGLGFNNRSLVLKLSYQGFAFLFPGDIERPAEALLANRCGEALKSDVLLSPHHGSATSSSDVFLARVRPRICVISCGAGGDFPDARTLAGYSARGCEVFRTDCDGAVVCTVREGRLSMRTYNGRKLELRGAPGEGLL